tara:strand:+ start:6140 stop:6373 length:234 start_codon:yes stop_codon:yes gene_type:complete
MREVLEALSMITDKPWASTRATQALEIAEQFDGGGLDEWEYQEIMLRLIDDSKLDKEADDLETKSLLISAVHQVSGI